MEAYSPPSKPAHPRHIPWIVVLLLFLSVSTACALENVSIQQAWKHQFQFAGHYAALNKAFYRQAGLAVPLIEGGQDKFARETVAGGRAQFMVRMVVVLSLLLAAVILILIIFNRKLTKQINERLRVEKRLRDREQLLNKMGALAHIGGWEHDLITRHAVWTDETYKITGITSAEVPGPDEHLDAYPSPYREQLETAYANAMKTGETFSLELQYNTAEQHPIWVHVVGRPKFEDGKCIKMKGTLQDITRQKRLEMQLHQARKMEAVGRLAGGVAHDFNNMLGVILGNAEILLEDMDSADPLAVNVQEIHRATKRSADLTRQLLAFARKQAIAPRILDINQVVADMLKMLQRLIGEDITLSWLPGQDVHPVKMDTTQVDQMLANLCLNARDAIQDGGRITIETSNVVFDEAYCQDHTGFHPGRFVMIAVSDNGVGMNRETRENLFEPFFTTKPHGKGSGLGLATVYGIMKQNNGFINVYSEPGQGSTLKIYLPALPKAVPADRESHVSSPPRYQGSATILLVEDETAILHMTRMLLERSGYTVRAFDDPGKALDIARASRQNSVELLITDVVMPGMNGRELADQLRKIYPDIQCLFMSGYTANVIAHRGVLDDGIYFISKPFSRQDLTAKVHEILSGNGT